VLFQPEARGDGGGAAVQTAADEEAVHPEENIEAHPQDDPQLKKAEGDDENDKTEARDTIFVKIFLPC
jgi:hypothetical protein